MAIFRKNKKTGETASERRYRLEAESNQSKWDELERLVSEQETPKSLDSLKNKPLAKTGLSDLQAHDLRSTDLDSLSTDLKIDMPEDSEFMDVTPPESTELSDIDAGYPAEPTKSSAIEAFIPAPPATNRPDRADIGAMRLDVARISADIQSGEELYRRAQQRIENLTSFVERAEIDFSMLNRLEPENRRLKARNRTIEREIDANAQKMEVLRADLEDREQRLAEKTRVYETTLGKLVRWM